MRNKFSFILTLLSFCLLIPGVTLPMFHLKVSGAVNSSLANLDLNVLDQSRSILQTVMDLWDHNQHLASFLIFLFSIVVPVMKGISLLFHLLMKKTSAFRKMISSFMRRIAKWSMADVFVVATFLAYLSTSGTPSESFHNMDLFGMKVKFKTLLTFSSFLGVGFYYFLGYCLSSLLAFELYNDKE